MQSTSLGYAKTFTHKSIAFAEKYKIFCSAALPSRAGVANRGALRQIWRIACLEVAHCRFKIFRAI